MRVFVSSTFDDLEDYRQATNRAIDQLARIFVGMEHFGSRPGAPVEESLRQVGTSKIYVGIVALRYGTIDTETGKSITQREYETAKALQLPCLIYLLDENKQPVLARNIDRGASADKLEEFKAELKRDHTVGFFTTPDDLAKQVSVDLPRLILEHVPLPGMTGPAFAYGYDVAETLGRLLTQHRKRLSLGLEDVINIVRSNSVVGALLPTDLAWFGELEQGRILPTSVQIPALAVGYNIEPSVLQAFGASPEQGIIHLGPSDDFMDSTLFGEDLQNVFHRLPKTKLRGSGTIILRVKLGPKGLSISHKHPGEEVAVVLSGTLRALFPDRTGQDRTYLIRAGEIIHFDSSIKHQFSNESDSDDCDVIVIRRH